MILGGVRTATVLVVGTATLVTPVGGRSLGNYIFAGLESLNYTTVVFGCLMAGLLAVVLDQLVHLLELAAATPQPPAGVGRRIVGLLLAGGRQSVLPRLPLSRLASQSRADCQRAVHGTAHPERSCSPSTSPRPAFGPISGRE